MPPELENSALIALGIAVLAFLVRWLFSRAERTLDNIVTSIRELVGSVGIQSTRLAVLEAKVELLEQEVAALRADRRSA